eukprot:UC1_evm1s1794
MATGKQAAAAVGVGANFSAFAPMYRNLTSLLGIANVRNFAVANITFTYSGDGGMDMRQQYFSPAGLLSIATSEDVSVSNCVFQHAGTSGLHISSNVSRLTVSHVLATDLGGEGITMSSDRGVNGVLITDTSVTDTGHIYLKQPAGIRLRGQNVSVIHSAVSHVPYGGILAGWQAGRPTPPGATGAVSPLCK